MKTKFLKINPKNPDKKVIRLAAGIIRKGGLVAFPTETVYGLGANGLDEKAVRKIFRAKRRPADDPLIFHIASPKDLLKLVKRLPPKAKILTRKFWPGPLTLILKKKGIVPNEATAGLENVAVRMPDHLVALELIRASGVPIAAPSANLFGRPSPTSAGHVIKDLNGRIDAILDGGPAKIGVESTVLDLTVHPPVILRPGGVTLEKLKKFLPNAKLFLPDFSLFTFNFSLNKSPGMKYRHYAPKAKLILAEGNYEKMAEKINALISRYQKRGKKVGVMATNENKYLYQSADKVLTVGDRKKVSTIAKNLFKIIREMDKGKVDIILAEGVPEKGLGLAVMNRLRRASVKIIKT